jgi:hypothetical protein
MCATTDASGSFTIAGIPSAASGFAATVTGYMAGIWPLTGTADLTGWNVSLRSTARMSQFAANVGASLGATTGVVHAIAYDAAGNYLAGVTITTSPAGTVGYVAASGDAIATPAETGAAGEAFVFGLTPGQVDVTFSAPGLTCTLPSRDDWPAVTAGDTESVPIQAGGLTFAAANCK